MSQKQNPNTNKLLDITDTFDELTEIRCSLEQIIFIKNAMYETDGACTPASLLDYPIADITASLKKIDDFLKTID